MITWWTSLWNWRIAKLSTKRRSTLQIISCKSLDASSSGSAASAGTLRLNAAARYIPASTSSSFSRCPQRWTTSTTRLTLRRYSRNSASRERCAPLTSTCTVWSRRLGRMPLTMQLRTVTALLRTETMKVSQVQPAWIMVLTEKVSSRAIVPRCRLRMEMNRKRI